MARQKRYAPASVATTTSPMTSLSNPLISRHAMRLSFLAPIACSEPAPVREVHLSDADAKAKTSP